MVICHPSHIHYLTMYLMQIYLTSIVILLCQSHNIGPKSYDEESKFACWKAAMQNKLNALDKACARQIVDLPAHVKSIGCTLVAEPEFFFGWTIKTNT